MKKAIITVGLGFGDEGKGALTDALCRQHKADLVIRYSGGSQCGHNVQLNGRRHTFSQFGAGTLSGVKTYLAPKVIIDPISMINEASDLIELSNPFNYLMIDKNCLVSTVFHRNLNRIKTTINQHGSCGHGIGETRKYWLDYGQDAIIAEDLKNLKILKDKLELLKQRVLIQLSEFDIDINLIKYTNVVEIANDLYNISKNLNFCSECPEYNIGVYEGAQGMLLDEWYGFHPYTTWSTVTPQHAVDLAKETGASSTIIGVIRSYYTRHGNGPFPTESYQNKIFGFNFEDEGNPENQWQGKLRCGCFDFVLYNYAVKICKQYWKLDGVFVNHVDQLESYADSGVGWPVCLEYSKTFDFPLIFNNLKSQIVLTNQLMNIKAQIGRISREGFFDYIGFGFDSPIVGMGYGPDSKNKKWLDNWKLN